MSFFEKLESALRKDKRFIDTEGNLIRSEIIEKAFKTDTSLIELLLSDKTFTDEFFTNIKGHFVFDINKFTAYIQDKNFLNDSYTKYRNKIGLNIGNKFLKEREEVCLAFPFKDCVLEGGQTKEEESRREIFFNEILAKDEINRLFDPKVLTNFEYWDSEAVKNNKPKQVKSFKTDENGDIKDNLLIKGNNLLALHCLKEKFAGKIKLIYIDPPYNTGNDGFKYNDNFKHSSWLTFMKNRLEIARELLSNDGIIFVSVDDIEFAYLSVLLDEIIGRNNFLANVAYERSGVSGLGQGGQFLVNNHENILCYAKNKMRFSTINTEGNSSFDFKDMKRYSKIFVSSGIRKEIKRFKAPSTGEDVIIYKHEKEKIKTISLASYEKRKAEIKKIYIEEFPKIFRNTIVQKENKFQTQIMSICKDGLYSADYIVSRGKHKGKKITAYYYNGQVFAWLKDTSKIIDNVIYKTNKLSTFWSHSSLPKADLANEGGVELRRGKKPETLLKQILQISTKPNDIVLDFFAGSGTTPAVAHKMGRQWIAIEQMDYIKNLPEARIKKVIEGEQGGISKAVNWKGGGEFKYIELKTYNQSFMDKIQKAKSTNELLKIWQEMQEKSFITWNIEIKKMNEDLESFKKLTIKEQKDILCSCVDKNQLYVNLSEIADMDYKVTEEDKKLNKEFYKT